MKHLYFGSLLATFGLIVLAACGLAKKADANLQIGSSTCKTDPASVAQKVSYIGTRGNGTPFSVDSDYVGVILTALSDGDLQVKWTPSDAGTTATTQSEVSLETTCTPSLFNKTVLYKGMTGSGTKFPNVGKDYFGTVLATFDNGSLQVDWGTGVGITVEPQSKLSIQK